MNVTIDFLKNHPNLVETCARWSFEEWGRYTPEKTLADFIASRKKYAQHDSKLPLTIIALIDDKPVGMCSLVETRGILPDLCPWLAALYVEPEYRNRGIGALLEEKIGDVAREFGYQKIYCFTSDKTVVPWYEKHGWLIREGGIMRDHEVVITEKILGGRRSLVNKMSG